MRRESVKKLHKRKNNRSHKNKKHENIVTISENKYHYPLRFNKREIGQQIIKDARTQFEQMMKGTDKPMLKRLFRDSNKEKFDKIISEYKIDYDHYPRVLKKELSDINNPKFYKNKPNQDYYTYVNYGWIKDQTKKLKEHPEYYVEVDDFRIVQDKVYRQVLDLLKKFIRENPDSKKAKDVNAIYKCIMNNTKRHAFSTVKQIQNEINDIINNKSVTDMISYLNRNEVISWQSPIVWNVLPDEKNVKKYKSHLSTPTLGLYDYFIYIEDPKDTPEKKKFKETFKKKYLEFIGNVFKTCLPDEYKEYDPMDIWDVECQLLDAMGCDKIKKEDPNYYNVLTKHEIEEDYGFDWTDFCIKQGYKKDKIPNKVIVSSLNSLKCTMELMKNNWTSKKWRTWYLFIHYKQIIRFEWDWNEVYFNFYGKFVTGQPVRFPKELYPIFMLSVTFNTLLTELYVKEYLDTTKAVYVYNLVEDLKQIFINKLERNTWLSGSTKKSAINKLKKLEVVITMPDSASAETKGLALQEDPLLDYKDDNPYYNLKILSDWKRKRFVNLEGENVIDIPEIDWNVFKLVGTQAYMVNAYYRPTSNSIYVPLAYLQRPFMDLENYGIEYNLAYMGYTLGHELSHSLDDMGSKFDENGNLNNWWTDEDRKKYQKKIDNVVKQYEEVAKRDGIKFDASIGVGEDLADISGLALAEEYLFYYQIINNQIPLVKDLSLKQFYIFTAIQSRQKIFDKAIPAQLKQNPHPLEKYRCNCPLSRLSIFRQLYDVKKGDGMWWENTDTIW